VPAIRDEIERLRNERWSLQRLLAKCGEVPKGLGKGLKAVGPILNYYDVIKQTIDSLAAGREPTLEELGSAYLGYPVELQSSSPPII
jgi:hypothetical protein